MRKPSWKRPLALIGAIEGDALCPWSGYCRDEAFGLAIGNGRARSAADLTGTGQPAGQEDVFGLVEGPVVRHDQLAQL